MWVRKDDFGSRGPRAGWWGGHYRPLADGDVRLFHTPGRLSPGVAGTLASAELTPSLGLGVGRAVSCLPLAIHFPRDDPQSAKYLSFKDATLSGHGAGQDNRGR